MTSKNTPAIRKSAKSRCRLILMSTPAEKKTGIIDRLIDTLEYSQDSWLQRNIVDIIFSQLNASQEYRVKQIMNYPNISPYVRHRYNSLSVGFLKKPNGFTLVEVVVSIAIASVLMAGASLLMKSMVHYYQTMKTVETIKKIEKALDVTYRESIQYVENNCINGWISCSRQSLLPQVNSSLTVSHLYVYNPTSETVQAWKDAGCLTVYNPSPYLYIYCSDGFSKATTSAGATFTFTLSNNHTPGTLYTNGYTSTPFTITITSTGNPDISDTWSSGYLDNEYLNYSKRKIIALSNALKQYHLSRLLHETTVNTCDSTNGGLESYDDVIIPWYFQVTGNAPNQECTGIESGICGCSGFSSTVWPTVSTWQDVTGTEWTTVLANLNLSTIYRTDGFGNPLTLWFTVNSSNALQGIPPRPRPNYDGAWSVRPPYRGLVGVYNTTSSSWVYYDSILYPQ